MTGEEGPRLFAVKEGEKRLELEAETRTRRTEDEEDAFREHPGSVWSSEMSMQCVSSCIQRAAGSSAVEVLTCLILVARAAGWK